jgi:probable HAF family extracellular repeat protein
MSDWLVLTGRTLVLKENMKTLIFFYFYTRSMLKVGFLCLLLLSAAKGQPGYTITDLGTLGGSFSVASGINNGGQVVGFSPLSDQAPSHAFLYSGGQMLDLGTLGGSVGVAFGINNGGQIVGESTLIIGPRKPFHAFLYSGGQMQDLNNLLPPNSGWIVYEAVGINGAGQIACSGSNGQATHALLLTPVSQ